MCSISNLQLQCGRWYCGSTIRHPQARIQEHRAGYGCKFTQRYPMIRVTHCFPVDISRASQLENETWMWLARQHGPDRCRGGDVTIVQRDDSIPDWCLPEEFGGKRRVCWG